MTNCKDFYGLDNGFFEERGCINTASEIASQPKLWNDLAVILQEKKQYISDFMQRLSASTGGVTDNFADSLSKMRIILTGAGSSAFIGEALSGFIAKSRGIKCEAVHTTDIVSAPETVLFSDVPTLLISFARSGNSPESVGAVQYARKKVKNLFEATIVCDGSSKLYNVTAEDKKNLVLVMPEGSNDKGFAMTSSVSCMLLAGFALLNFEKIDEIVKDIKQLSKNMEGESLKLSEKALRCAKIAFDRAVYLASGAFKGLAHEGSLKMLELSYGNVNTSFDSATGFRHGPKAVIKDNTMSLHFISSDLFTAKYDIDLLLEVYRQKSNNKVIAICSYNLKEGNVKENYAKEIEADEIIMVPSSGYGLTDHLCTGIGGLVFFQMLAMFKSLELGITTDNPSPGGQVNRVVKGVTVHLY